MTHVLDSLGRHKQTTGIARGIIIAFSGSAVPDGWLLCDGTNGTPDMRDRFVIGDSAVGVGSTGGTVSATAALTHAGAAVGAHSAHGITQPAAHGSHAIGQAAGHTDHSVGQATTHTAHASGGAHTHDAHATATSLAGATAVIADGFTHSSDGAHTHDAHPAHSAADVDAHSAHASGNLDAHSAHSATALDAHSAHSVTQPDSHAVIKTYLLAFLMKG